MRASRIARGELFGVESVVRDVATATTGDFDFSQGSLALLVDGDLCRRFGFGCGDGGEVASRATDDDRYGRATHAAKFLTADGRG